MKTNRAKIIIVALLILLLLISVIFYLVYHIFFPKTPITSLIPHSTLAYVNMLNLNETVSSIERSEFIKRFVNSKLWRDIQSSPTWQEIIQQKNYLEESVGLNRNMLMRLIGKNTVFAVTSENYIRTFVLISELDIITRIILTSRKIEKNIASEYGLIKEEYKGIKFMTLKLPEQTISYSFIGRIGVLCNNPSIIKDVIDLYKQKSIDKFSKMFIDIPLSNVYIYLNTQRSEEISDILRTYNININLSKLNIIKFSDAWVGMIDNQVGSLRINSLIFYKNAYAQANNRSENSKENYVLPIPGKNLMLLIHENQDPSFLFNLLSKYLAPQISLIRNELETLFTSSLAEAIVKPDITQLRMIPPLLIFLRVRNRVIAETMLNNFIFFIEKQYPNSDIQKIDYKNNRIVYIKSSPVFLLPTGIGYVLLKDNIFVMSTELYSLKDVIDTAIGKKRSFVDDKEYQNVMKLFEEKSDNKIFINLKAVTPIIDQIAKLYIWQSRLLGKKSYEKAADYLIENIIILQNWNYLGLSFKKYGNSAKLSLILNK